MTETVATARQKTVGWLIVTLSVVGYHPRRQWWCLGEPLLACPPTPVGPSCTLTTLPVVTLHVDHSPRSSLPTLARDCHHDRHRHCHRHRRIDTQSHSHTLSRSHTHSHTVTRSHSHTATLPHSVTQCHTASHSVTQCHTVELSHYHTVSHKSHSHTNTVTHVCHTQSHSHTL